MNRCRTCKYWSINPSQIGVGICLNFEALLRLALGDKQSFSTAQDFGCQFWQGGESAAEIEPREKQVQMLREFVLDRYHLHVVSE